MTYAHTYPSTKPSASMRAQGGTSIVKLFPSTRYRDSRFVGFAREDKWNL